MANLPKPPLFSVIIPTCHRNDTLALCLDLLAPGKQAGVPHRDFLSNTNGPSYEVIVSDDGAGSTAEKLVHEVYPWVKWTKGPRRGPAANRNHGAKLAEGTWLVFTDDDCQPDPKWLLSLSRGTVEHPKSPAFEGAILPLGSMEIDLPLCPVNTTGGCFWSANVAIRRDHFREIGGFDENYPIAANEDEDIYHRLGGKKTVPFIESAIIRHPVRRATLGSMLHPRRFLPLHRSWAYYVSKNGKYLGIRSIPQTAFYSLRWYGKNLAEAVRDFNWRRTVLCLAEICIGIPLTACFQLLRRPLKPA